MLIATTALNHGIPLATRNTADFEGCGIQLINPFLV
jgi:predicted nucleic acid-binding protein